jgi:hypothetical protein
VDLSQYNQTDPHLTTPLSSIPQKGYILSEDTSGMHAAGVPGASDHIPMNPHATDGRRRHNITDEEKQMAVLVNGRIQRRCPHDDGT